MRTEHEVTGEYLATTRRLRRMGITVSVTVLAAAIAGGTVSGALPGIPYRLVAVAVAVIVSGLLLYVGDLFVQNKGQVHCAWQSGRLIIEVGVPPFWVASSKAPQLHDGAIQVSLADDVRGYGAFATMDIKSGTFIGQYEGEVIDLACYYNRYNDGMSDYCITIDDEWVIDGQQRASDRKRFSPCHINHSRQRFNVARRTLPDQKRVEFYLIKDVRCGDELLLNYGHNYWKNREDLELP